MRAKSHCKNCINSYRPWLAILDNCLLIDVSHDGNVHIQYPIIISKKRVQPSIKYKLKDLWEHPTTGTSCSAKMLFYSGYFAGKIGLVLCVAGKMKYNCWELF